MRAWRCAGALPLMCLGACKAETLGVELPAGGTEAISMEDVQRDVWMLENPRPSQPSDLPSRARSEVVAGRLQQMHALPGFGKDYLRTTEDGLDLVCGLRDGTDPNAVVIAVLDGGRGSVSGTVALAGLISLAKAFDVPAAPTNTMVFCALPEVAGWDAYSRSPAVPLDSTKSVIRLGDLSGPAVGREAGPPMGALGSLLLAAPGTAPELGAVDFARVAANVREVYSLVVAGF